MQVVEKDGGGKRGMKRIKLIILLMILFSTISIISINILQDNYQENSKKLNQIIEKYSKITNTYSEKEKAYAIKKNPLLERWKIEDKLVSNNTEYKTLKQKNNTIKIAIDTFKTITLLSVACISIFISIFIFKHIHHYIKNNIIYKTQRIGVVLLCFGFFLMIWAWVFFTFDEFPGKYIADTSELYGIIFFISLFLIIISIGFISCLFQKIYKWISDGN